MRKRILSIILTLTLCLSLLPIAALAAEGTVISTEFTSVGGYYFKASADSAVTVTESEGTVTVTINGNGTAVSISNSAEGSEAYTWTSKADTTTFTVNSANYIYLTSGAVAYAEGPTVTHGSGIVSVTDTYVSLDRGEKATINDFTYELSNDTSGSCNIYHGASGSYKSGDIQLYNTSLTVSQTVGESTVSATYKPIANDSITFQIGEDPSTITFTKGSITVVTGDNEVTYTSASNSYTTITIKGCNTETPYFSTASVGTIEVTSGSTVYFESKGSNSKILSATAGDGASAKISNGSVTVTSGAVTLSTVPTDGSAPSSTVVAAGSGEGETTTVTPSVSTGGKLTAPMTAGTVTITNGQSVTFGNDSENFTYTAGENTTITVSRANDTADYDTVTVTSGSVTVSAAGYTDFNGPATYEKEGDAALEFKFHHFTTNGIEVTSGTASIGAGTYYLYDGKYVTVADGKTATVTSAGVTGPVVISTDSTGSTKIATVSDGLTADLTKDPVAVSGDNGTVTLEAGKSVTIDGRQYTAGESSGTITITNGEVTQIDGITAGPIIIIYDGTATWTDTTSGVIYTALEASSPVNIELTPNDNGTVTVKLPNGSPIEIKKGDVAHQFSVNVTSGAAATLTVDSNGNVTLAGMTSSAGFDPYLSVFPNSAIKVGNHTFRNTGEKGQGYTGVFEVDASGNLKFVRNAYCTMGDGTTVNCTYFSSGGDGAVITADNNGTLTLSGSYTIEVNGLKFTTLHGEGTATTVSGVFDGTPYLSAGGVQVSDADTTDNNTTLMLYFLNETDNKYYPISSENTFGYSLTTGLAATGGVTVNSGVTILVNGNYVTGPCTISKETYSANSPDVLTGLATVTATANGAKIGDGITLNSGAVVTITYSDSAENPGNVALTAGSAAVAAVTGIEVNDVSVIGPATVTKNTDGTATVDAQANAAVGSGIGTTSTAQFTISSDGETITLTKGTATISPAGGDSLNVGNYTVNGINTTVTVNADGSYTIVDKNASEGVAAGTKIQSGATTLLTIQNATVTIKDGKITLDNGSVTLADGQSIIVSGITVDTTGNVTVTDGKAGLTANGTGAVTGTYGQKQSELTVTGLTATIGTTNTEVPGTWALSGDGDTVLGADATSGTAIFTPSANAEKFETLTASATITITKATPSVVLTKSISGEAGNRTVTLAATVTGVTGASVPSGTVSFKNGTIALGDAVSLNNGAATFEWTVTTDAEYTIMAEYAGDTNYNTASGEVELDTRDPFVATPVISPDGGTYTASQSVTITSATEGATIYYTTDGSEPSASNGTEYTGAISISNTTTIKAIAVKDKAVSGIVEATFTIQNTPTTPDIPIIPTPSYYDITMEPCTNGDVSANRTNAVSGTTITLTVAPDSGYELSTLTVTDKYGNTITVTENTNGTYTFGMPSKDVWVTASFTKAEETPDVPGTTYECPRDSTCPMYGYADLDRIAWYHDGVHYCIENGLMQGTGNNQFNPDGTTTRAMIVTILWRLEGSPVVNYLMDFEDVAADQWYTEAIRWAQASGIVEGYGDTFGPNDSITREQVVTIMWRYAKYKGYDVSVGESTNILSYGDAFDVAEWAIPAMQWACGSGMIKGIADGDTMNLAPQGNATRAQSAAILQRFCENVAK